MRCTVSRVLLNLPIVCQSGDSHTADAMPLAMDGYGRNYPLGPGQAAGLP